MCYNCVTILLHFCNNFVPILSQLCYNFVTIFLQFSCIFVTIMLQFCYIFVTIMLQFCYIFVTILCKNEFTYCVSCILLTLISQFPSGTSSSHLAVTSFHTGAHSSDPNGFGILLSSIPNTAD